MVKSVCDNFYEKLLRQLIHAYVLGDMRLKDQSICLCVPCP